MTAVSIKAAGQPCELIRPRAMQRENRNVDVVNKFANSQTSLRAVADAGREIEQDLAWQATIACARQGDRAAIEALVVFLTPSIKNAIARRLRAAVAIGKVASLQQQRDDLAQETLLAFFSNDAALLQRWDPERGLKLERYAALIADRRTISFLRGLKPTEHATPLDDEQGQDFLGGVEPSPSPQRWLESHQTLQLLLAGLSERLSPLGRQLFDLLYVRDLSVEQISRETGMTADAIYAWRSRLRRQMRSILQQLESEAE